MRAVSEERWRRAQGFELAHQRRKALRLRGRVPSLAAARTAYAAQTFEILSPFLDLSSEMRVLEVGAGPHGISYFLPTGKGFALDPLAPFYRQAFAELLGSSQTTSVAGRGEELPFTSGSFALVICDNVLDHVRDPAAVLAEAARILAAGGILCLGVDVHRWGGHLLSRVHERLVAPRRVLRAFGPHPFCFRARQVEAAVTKLGLRIVRRQLHAPAPPPTGASWTRRSIRALFGTRFLLLICVREGSGGWALGHLDGGGGAVGAGTRSTAANRPP
jgi:SAM-dependent methyltransferase